MPAGDWWVGSVQRVSVWQSGATAVPQLREPCGDVQGRQAPSHPAPMEDLQGVTACPPKSPSVSQGTWSTVHSRARTHECERPEGWGWPSTRHPWFLHHCIGKIGWEGARQAGEGPLTWQEIREQWRFGEGKGTVLSFATVNLWCSWIQAEEPEAWHGTTPAQPGRRLVHTSMKAAIKPPWSTLQAKRSLWEGVLLERTVLMIIKTLVLTCKPHLCRTQKILNQTRSAKAVKEEEKRIHLFEANTSYLCFIRDFLLSWHCVIYIFNLTRCPLLCKIYTSIERLWNTQGNNFSVDWVLNGKTSLNAILQIRRSPAF